MKKFIYNYTIFQLMAKKETKLYINARIDFNDRI
jgi:hypothetical protein